MDGLKECLQELTKSVCKAINVLNEALREEDQVKRDKKASRALKEIEVINDDAMRSGLGLSVNQIVQQKTRSRGTSKSAKITIPKVLSPFQQLMAHHAEHIIGPIPDPSAQGSAIKWILESFTPELAIKKYDSQLEISNGSWRVSWLTVKRDIGRIQTHGARPMDAAERNAERLNGNLSLIEDLRRNAG